MSTCLGILSGDIAFDCTDLMLAGLEVDAVFVNHSDVDYVNSTVSGTNDTIVTNLQLKAGKTGYLFPGVKQINSLAFELVPKETTQDKFKHTFTGMMFNLSAANKLQLSKMVGGLFLVVVELKWKGSSSEDAFQVGGYNQGMRLTAVTWSSNENDGNVTLEFSSADGYEEPKPILTLLETDYATTSTAFKNKFLQP